MIEIFLEMNPELRLIILTIIVIWLYMEWQDNNNKEDKWKQQHHIEDYKRG